MVAADDKDRQHVFASLHAVGATKPLGYLPLNTLEKPLAMNVNDVAQSFRMRGLEAKVFSVDECCINSGAFYVYDRLALQRVLDEASELLKQNGWPIVAELFVERVSKNWVESTHPVHQVIRRAFGESV